MFDWPELEAHTAKLLGIDEAFASDDDLLDVARSLGRLRAMLDATETRVLGEMDARSSCDLVDGLSTSRWLARETRVSPGTAKARLKVAVALRRHLPHTTAALADGQVSFDHAQVLGAACNPRIAEAFAEFEQELIDMVPGLTFGRWRDHVNALAALGSGRRLRP